MTHSSTGEAAAVAGAGAETTDNRLVAPASDISPCPFCGGKAKLWIGRSEFVDGEINCEICAASSANFPDAQTAIAAWNRRAP